MSNLFRKRMGIQYTTRGVREPITSNADDSDVYEGYVQYSPEQYHATDVDSLGTNDLLYPQFPQFPGQREAIHGEFETQTTPNTSPNYGAIGQSFDKPNALPTDMPKVTSSYAISEDGGASGIVDALPYSTGVVSSDLVENFWLDGRQALIRRKRNPSDTGPVGTSDPNAILSIVFAQQANQYFPNESSQGDLVKAV